MNVLVLLGGNSPEREVSIRSAKGVIEALRGAGHTVEEYDPADGYGGLAGYRGEVDCVFPILHGVGGEDGEVQSELEKYGFRYLGSDAKVSKICFDKVAFKEELEKLRISTPKWQVVTKETIKQAPLSEPYVLKPIENGSAIDMFIVRDPKTQSYDSDIFEKYEEMLFEELIVGTEITVPILGAKALPLVEIIPPKGQEFDYENKYNGKTRELCPPVHVPQEKQSEAQRLIEKVHSAVGARHLSRTDIIVDDHGRLMVLDFNSMPGLTAQSLYPKAAKEAGISMEALVQKFLDLATG